MPVVVGKWRNNSIAASNPPADPPIPTIGQLKFCLAGSDLACALANFDRDDLLPLVLIREENALDFGFRFAAIGRVYVSLRLLITQVAIKRERESPVLWPKQNATPAGLTHGRRLPQEMELPSNG
jgi:hypothetical protein